MNGSENRRTGLRRRIRELERARLFAADHEWYEDARRIEEAINKLRGKLSTARA